MARLPLEGIRVVDLTVSWAGPKVTQCLGDMGAEVIKVESIQYLDAQRGRKMAPKGMEWYPGGEPGERPWNRYASFNQLNRNKLGITLDLIRPRGKEIFHQLVSISDIVVDSFAASVLEDLLDYQALKKVKPDIITMRMPGFGMSGPYRDYRSWGSTVDCMAGGVSARGYPGGEPLMPRAYGDPIVGLTGAFAILVALHHREKTGEGQFIDISQVEALVPFSIEHFMDYVLNGKILQPSGSLHPFMAPHAVYRCRGRDKWVAIAVASEEEWKALGQAMGEPAWIKEERFATMGNRWKHQEELNKLLETWTREKDIHEVMSLLQARGVATGALLTYDEIFSNLHLLDRGFFQKVYHPEAGAHSYPGQSWKLSRIPGGLRRPAPCLGEHNRYVLGDLLGISEEEIGKLEAEQIIGIEPLEEAIS